MAVILTGTEYIDLDAHGAALNIPNRPISWYVEFTSSVTNQIMFLLSHGRNSGAGTQEYAQLWINSSQVRSRWNGAVVGQVEVVGANTNNGSPHRFATVIRSSIDSMAQFLDGAASTTGNPGGNLATANINDTTAIGRDAGASQFFFVGQVANVAIWDIELTTQQAQDLTAGVITPLDIPSGLLGYWPLDYDARDASGNGLHGTPVGDPAFTESPPGGVTADITHGLVIGHQAAASSTVEVTAQHGLTLGHQVGTALSSAASVQHGLVLGHQIDARVPTDVAAQVTHGLILGHRIVAHSDAITVGRPIQPLADARPIMPLAQGRPIMPTA